MSLRMPQNFRGGLRLETGESVLDAELLAEKAASLGRAVDGVARALNDLSRIDPADPAREDLLQRAADAVYGYFIQRELIGFFGHDDAIKHYAIPGAVLARLGSK